MPKSISTEQTRANITAVLDILTDLPDHLDVLSKSLAPDQLRIPLGDGERSFTEDLAPLVVVFL